VAAAAPKATGQRIYLSVGEKEGSGRIGGSAQMTDGFNGLAAGLKGRPGVILRPSSTRAKPTSPTIRG